LKRITATLLFFLSICNLLIAQTEAVTKEGRKVILYPDQTWAYKDAGTAFEIPQASDDEEIIKHTAYTLSWNPQNRQANWVAYQLTADRTRPIVGRTNKFLADSAVSTTTAADRDYVRSGYDRGHLVPAADMAWSAITMKESFYYSNISPQVPAFNRGIWKKLEEKVRAWAVDNQDIYVVTGPVFSDSVKTIGPNKVAVPAYFYKVIADNELPQIKGIAFIMPNAGSSLPLETYAVTIDSIERLTGINFFPQLSFEDEKLIESAINIADWFSVSKPANDFGGTSPKKRRRQGDAPAKQMPEPAAKE